MMNSEDYYRRIHEILNSHQIQENEIDDMIDFLKETAAESGMSEASFLHHLGTPEVIASDFLAQTQRSQTSSLSVPPIPEDALSSENGYEEKEDSEEWHEKSYSMDKDRIPEMDDHSDLPHDVLYENNPGFTSLRKIDADLLHSEIQIDVSDAPRVEVYPDISQMNIHFHHDTLKIEQNAHMLMLPWNLKKKTIKIYLPKEVMLDKVKIEGVNASIFARSLHANHVMLESVSGKMVLQDCEVEKLRASNVNGLIQIENTPYRKASIENVNGDIDMQVMMYHKIHAETVTGHIHAGGILESYAMKTQFIGSELNYHPNQSYGKTRISSVSGSLNIWL
ncbi:DUF4097 family beta strand repeat-containing protein [Ileibacterium valens]|uniref:DUF4097 family beta strand repeat-containing protein n=1 Tax=Ileibacterium valens TaxID=1862668 RepID=UPI00259B3A80|nr:DUF4097 family beta strand repeat-containing protein [Ileibacterium valens]